MDAQRGPRRISAPASRAGRTVSAMNDEELLAVAIEQARIGLSEGGVPIGGALVVGGEVLGAGHNRRVQLGSAIRHGETDALEVAGRLPASKYRRATMATTLSPCDMCTGAILLYGIPRIVIGENRSFQASEGYLGLPSHQPSRALNRVITSVSSGDEL